MIPAWTLVVFSISGVFAQTPHYLTIPMASKEACIRAAEDLIKDSKGIGIACIDSGTGEVIRRIVK